MVRAMKSREKIEDVLARVSKQLESGSSRYGGMSYEDGVDEALRWVIDENDSDEWPFVDDDVTS